MGHLAVEADNEAEGQEKVQIQYHGEWESASKALEMEQGHFLVLYIHPSKEILSPRRSAFLYSAIQHPPSLDSKHEDLYASVTLWTWL